MWEVRYGKVVGLPRRGDTRGDKDCVYTRQDDVRTILVVSERSMPRRLRMQFISVKNVLGVWQARSATTMELQKWAG